MKKLLLLICILSGCGSSQNWSTYYMGEVIKVEGEKVCVTYNLSSGKRAFNCYDHFDGHSYSVGDRYPDFVKHRNN